MEYPTIRGEVWALSVSPGSGMRVAFQPGGTPRNCEVVGETMSYANIQQISIAELRFWAHSRGVDIVELEVPDIQGNRIFSATDGDETRVAKCPPAESLPVRDAWDARMRTELRRMRVPGLRGGAPVSGLHGSAQPTA
ncbi:hypothetical protein ACFO4E_22370 [Nocardiopsis mangrovi]|uniref:Uncharacterized protein n=1 Tax=Nocardiopsis mangrovi TaxID=1179818 RepID=A0ABV9E1P7_9ACTN